MGLEIPHIDWTYRPACYWEPIDGGGRNERSEIIRRQNRGDEPIHNSIYQLAGGTYLPRYLDYEIEIARVTIASVGLDVTSLRAVKRGDEIHYRVVDEQYGVEYRLPIQSSVSPLTLRELVQIFDQTRMLESGLEGNEDIKPPEHGWGIVLPEWKWQLVYFLEERLIISPKLKELGLGISSLTLAERELAIQQAREWTSISSDFYPELEVVYDLCAKSILDTCELPFEDTVLNCTFAANGHQIVHDRNTDDS